MPSRVQRREMKAYKAALHQFVRELRAILKRRAPAQRAQFPNQRPPCHTCAFNPQTDSWRGADATAFALLRALEEDQPFYCHEPFERTKTGWVFDRDKAILCAGYGMVIGDPDVKQAFVRALHDPGVAAQMIADKA